MTVNDARKDDPQCGIQIWLSSTCFTQVLCCSSITGLVEIVLKCCTIDTCNNSAYARQRNLKLTVCAAR